MSTNPLVLAVDDEPSIQRLVKLELEETGLRVVTAQTGREALAAFSERRPDVVVLDISLPDLSGLDVLRAIRERATTPVILLTGQTDTRDRVRGLDLGADDYLTKPFSPEELAARIRAVLRRAVGANAPAGAVVRAGPFSIDLERRVVERDGAIVPLTRTEWRLLQFLAEHPDKVMLSPQILSHVWGPEYVDDIQYLRVWVSRIRGKLAPELIRTFPRIGYQLSTDPSWLDDVDQTGPTADTDPDASGGAAPAQTTIPTDPGPTDPGAPPTEPH